MITFVTQFRRIKSLSDLRSLALVSPMNLVTILSIRLHKHPKTRLGLRSQHQVIQVWCKGNNRCGALLGLEDQGSYLVSQTLVPLFRFMGSNLQCNSKEPLRLIAKMGADEGFVPHNP